MSAKKFKENDRVKRVNGFGSRGTVKAVRHETVSSSAAERKEQPVMVNVQWDNGTQSYFAPDALELVQS